MATCSSILAWEILWTEEPGGLQFMGLRRVGHDLATEHVLFKVQNVILASETGCHHSAHNRRATLRGMHSRF